MTRTKANFRAIRETVGITQAALAAELGVQVRSVKRWESPSAPQQPPADAWELLEAALDAHEDVVDYGYEKAVELAEGTEYDRPTVHLVYWPDAETYAELSTDARHGIAGDWRRANANARATASVLRSHAFDVEFVDPRGETWLHASTSIDL